MEGNFGTIFFGKSRLIGDVKCDGFSTSIPCIFLNYNSIERMDFSHKYSPEEIGHVSFIKPVISEKVWN